MQIVEPSDAERSAWPEATEHYVRAIENRNAELEAALRKVVKSYNNAVPMRTAAMHETECACLRCAVDNSEAVISR